MINFKIDFKEVHAAIGNLHTRIDNPKDMLRDIGETIVEDIVQRIVKTKQDVDDKPFAPWKESTRIAREKEGTAARGILYRKGSLARSIKSQVTGKHTLKIFSTSPYAEYLDKGTPKMQPRHYMGISVRAQKGIDKILMDNFGRGRKT
jgi:phage gpG-like protein